MSARNPGIAAKDTKEESKSEREQRILKEFIRGTTAIGFKIADESVEELLVSFSDELMKTIEKEKGLQSVSGEVNPVKIESGVDIDDKKRTHDDDLSPICTVTIDCNKKQKTSEDDNPPVDATSPENEQS